VKKKTIHIKIGTDLGRKKEKIHMKIGSHQRPCEKKNDPHKNRNRFASMATKKEAISLKESYSYTLDID
jgi:hypothetical protein